MKSAPTLTSVIELLERTLERHGALVVFNLATDIGCEFKETDEAIRAALADLRSLQAEQAEKDQRIAFLCAQVTDLAAAGQQWKAKARRQTPKRSRSVLIETDADWIPGGAPAAAPELRDVTSWPKDVPE